MSSVPVSLKEVDRALQRKEVRCSLSSSWLPMHVTWERTVLQRVNTARSMLSSVLQLNNNSLLPVGQLPIVKRFMKGIYVLRPSLPRYLGFEYCVELLQQRWSLSVLSFKAFTSKLTLFVNPFEWTKVSDSQILFNHKYGALWPQMYLSNYRESYVGNQLKPVEFLAYSEDETFGVVKHSQE